ncbi:MAG: secondary thiamine-phosphate synthase enzyme YjbQ [Chthoniobacterales bacterium]
MALLFEWRHESVCRVEWDGVDTTLFLGESMRTERLKSGAGCRIEKGNRGRAEIFALPPMKSYRKELWFETKKRREFLRITPQINQCLRESGIQEGLVLINAMHITASVFINDNESGLHRDFDVWLEKLAPEKPYDQYEHNGAEDNADAHLKRTIMGREVVVAVTEGKLDFGPWEEIFYGEFDGRRRKRVLVKVIGE